MHCHLYSLMTLPPQTPIIYDYPLSIKFSHLLPQTPIIYDYPFNSSDLNQLISADIQYVSAGITGLWGIDPNYYVQYKRYGDSWFHPVEGKSILMLFIR